MTLSVQIAHHLPGFTLDLAFQAPGGVTALFGRSGAGKTTVVNAVAGLIRPDAGRIVLNDRVLFDAGLRIWLPPQQRRIGYVFQEGRLFPHLSVRQNLLYGRWFSRRAAGPDLGRITELLGLGDLLHRRPAALSGGEKQRVAIGRAILSDPDLLLLDEPLAALDAPRRAEILAYLERLRDEVRLPMLFVSHSVAEVARLATTLVLIEAGRLRHAGPAVQALADPALAPALGLRAAGAVLTARLVAQDPDGLTRLETRAGPLWLPRIAGAPGQALRLRVLAQDVMLAHQRPDGISALNILPVTVTALHAGDGPGVLVQMDCGGEALLARVTRRSAEAMALAPGMPLHAVIKALATAPGDVMGDVTGEGAA